MSVRAIISIMGAALLLPLLGGCQDNTTGPQALYDYSVGNFSRAEQILRPAAEKTDENYVLNNVRLGSAAIAQVDLPTTEWAFLNAYQIMNATQVNNGGRAVSAALIGEGTKVWKGEPFERAMCNYYLGTLYYIRHDYNNSRAAFENALFKLRDYGDADHPDQYSEFESDFIIGYLMLGKCYLHVNKPDRAKAMFDKARQLRPDLGPLIDGLQSPSNVLIVADWGWGPRKITTVDHAFAGFAPRPERAGPIPAPEVLVDGQPAALTAPPIPLVDLLALAQDHKWQDIDTIRAVKSVAGKALMGAGAYETMRGEGGLGSRGYNGNNVALGLGLIAAGALLDASSQADLRQWEMLPRTVFLVPMQLPPGPHDVTITFPSGEQQTLHGLIAPAQGEEAYYFRMLQSAPPDRYWPPAGNAAAAPN
jgi:tetratricopeptide (TPR) repeat protein